MFSCKGILISVAKRFFQKFSVIMQIHKNIKKKHNGDMNMKAFLLFYVHKTLI